MTCHDREHPGVFPPEVRAQATALACSLPKTQGKCLSRWSQSEIAAHLVALGQVVTIASSTVGRWLSAERLKPWRYHAWQQILDPQLFLARARPVLQVYEQAATLLAQGVWVVCVDEKTSIQARAGEQAPQAASQDHPQRVASRYKRQGALHLFAALSVADGRKYGQTHRRKRFLEFQSFLEQLILPEAVRRQMHTLKLILDNGTTHAPKQLERWLKEQIQRHGWPLQVEVLWLPPNASWLDQIEIWFSILQRKLLQPNHFESLPALEQAILTFLEQANRSPKPIRWTYTVEKLQRKLGTI
jgi:transposase